MSADEATTHLMFSGLSTNLWMRVRALVAGERSENSAILFMNFTWGSERTDTLESIKVHQ